MYAPRILLIKADPETHRGLRSRLERRGCEVAEASSQREAVEKAGEMEADLVVQENPVSDPGAPASFDEIMAAIEALVGPLPGPARTDSIIHPPSSASARAGRTSPRRPSTLAAAM